jgi:hypothetical protein
VLMKIQNPACFPRRGAMLQAPLVRFCPLC